MNESSPVVRFTPDQTLAEWQRAFPSRRPSKARKIPGRPSRRVSASDLEYLTAGVGAQILHRKPFDLIRAIERGELVGFQPGGEGAWLIRPADLQAWVESPESVRLADIRARALMAATRCRYAVQDAMESAGVDCAKLAEMTSIDAYDLEDSLNSHDERPFTVNELDAIADALKVEVVALLGDEVMA